MPHQPLNRQLAGAVEAMRCGRKVCTSLSPGCTRARCGLVAGSASPGHLDPGARCLPRGAARREYLDRGTEGRGDARRFKAPLGPTPAREASDLVDQLRVCGVDGVRRPQTAGERQAVVEHVDRDDRSQPASFAASSPAQPTVPVPNAT